MKCPNPDCEGEILVNRMRTDRVSDEGTIPGLMEWDGEWVICNECAETPSFTWETIDGKVRLVLLGGDPFPAHG